MIQIHVDVYVTYQQGSRLTANRNQTIVYLEFQTSIIIIVSYFNDVDFSFCGYVGEKKFTLCNEIAGRVSRDKILYQYHRSDSWSSYAVAITN